MAFTFTPESVRIAEKRRQVLEGGGRKSDLEHLRKEEHGLRLLIDSGAWTGDEVEALHWYKGKERPLIGELEVLHETGSGRICGLSVRGVKFQIDRLRGITVRQRRPEPVRQEFPIAAE